MTFAFQKILNMTAQIGFWSLSLFVIILLRLSSSLEHCFNAQKQFIRDEYNRKVTVNQLCRIRVSC